MNPHPALEKWVNWLLNHSLQTALLIVLVLAAQWIFRRRLAARWRFALWWIVLARLLLPFEPESAVSLFNHVSTTVKLEGPRYFFPPAKPAPPASQEMPKPNLISPTPDSISIAPPEKSISQNENFPASVLAQQNQTAPAVSKSSAPLQNPAPELNAWDISDRGFDDFAIPGLAALWLLGVLILSGAVLAQTISFQRKLSRASVSADADLRTLLENCRREFGVSRPIELLETDAVQSPALFGLWRLKLLLPRNFGAQFSASELRYIFLHELAHVKRGDLWLNWLVTILQIVHWFNPLVWFGFARLRADRELACDELALLRAGDATGTTYGETVVKLLENLSRPAAIPGLVGILEDKKQMRRRITMIANFRKPGRWSALAILLILGLAATALTNAQTNKTADVRPDLTGVVSAKDGKPLPVPATVFIFTAAPKTGTSVFCPSCYADCAKHARTDAQGRFKIESLDPQLVFRVLAVAKGYQPKYVSKVDPTNSSPLKIELSPVESAAAAPDRSLRGRVLNADGAPIEGAVVEMQGIETKDGGGRWGELPGVDPLAVTDEKGEFLITAKKPFDFMDVSVSARAFADKKFRKLAVGANHDLVLTEGVALTGRVLANGKPLAGISVGVSGANRESQVFAGHFEVGTDTNGDFTFVNLPPDTDFHLYGIMGTLKKFGAIPLQTIHTGKDGETTKVGDLTVAPAHRLAGRVVLADGKPLPAKVRLLVSRENAWDSMQIVLDKNGNFDTTGIPSEMVDLSARVKGYHISKDNLSLDQLNPFQLIGRVDGDITNLILKLDKGPELRFSSANLPPDYNESRNRPLRGAESVPDHSRDWNISGHVFDRETKQPIANFRVTPGETQAGGVNRTAWNTFETIHGTNGAYQIYVSKRDVSSVLLAEADGYLPATFTPLPGDMTNADFFLQRGSGPAGTVVTADGQPATNATLVLLNGDFNQANLDSLGLRSLFNNKTIQRETDAQGHFSFQPILGMKSVVAASTNGFAVASVESLATNSVITLQPFGKITGTLKRPAGLSTNEDLVLNFANDGGSSSFGLNLYLNATTDAQGRFTFNHVPPGHLEINGKTPMNFGSWRFEPLQAVDLKPGETFESNINAPERRTNEMENWRQPPKPKMISGEKLTGVVLAPSGKPAADADIALQIANVYLALGKAKFSSSSGRDAGYIVSADADGKFTLPLFENALSVVALNEQGFAQISLEQLKTSHQIQLQKWGTVEGTLHIGHRLGTNETMQLYDSRPMWSPGIYTNLAGENGKTILPPLTYDPDAFQSKTDDQGRFVITFVPPGRQRLSRRVPTGIGSWTETRLASLEVKPGETVVTNVGGTGRTVIGKLKLKLADGAMTNYQNEFVSIYTPLPEKIQEKMRNLKTDAERAAFYQSPETAAAFAHRQGYSTKLSADETFRVEDMLPGKYQIQIQQYSEDRHDMKMFVAAQEFVVPKAANANDDSVVDWGMIELDEKPLPKPTTRKK